MRHASGDYYRFVDVDDQLPPDSLEQLVRCAEKNQSDLVLAAYTVASRLPSSTMMISKCCQLWRRMLFRQASKYLAPFQTGIMTLIKGRCSMVFTSYGGKRFGKARRTGALIAFW